MFSLFLFFLPRTIQEYNEELECSLHTSMEIRWQAKYMMLRDLINNEGGVKDVITMFQAELAELELVENEWKLLKSAMPVLQKLFEVGYHCFLILGFRASLLHSRCDFSPCIPARFQQ